MDITYRGFCEAVPPIETCEEQGHTHPEGTAEERIARAGVEELAEYSAWLERHVDKLVADIEEKLDKIFCSDTDYFTPPIIRSLPKNAEPENDCNH